MDETAHGMFFACLNKLVQFLEFLERLIPKFMSLRPPQLEFKIFDALTFEVVGDFCRAVDDVCKFVSYEELCILGNGRSTCAVLMLPKQSPSLILVHSSSLSMTRKRQSLLISNFIVSYYPVQCHILTIVNLVINIQRTMSHSKHKSKKSLASSISDLSTSQKLRESIFNNDALAEIKNINVTDVIKSSRKEHAVNSAKKARTATKVAESKENKAYNYSAITKVVEEKNLVIETQERQIQNLKVTLERVRKDLDLTRVEHQKKKLDDLNTLRQQERQNEENIKQLETLKEGIKQMKFKMNAMEIQNAKLQRKGNEYLAENEQLTVKITSLKEEFFNQSVDQRLLNDLKQELQILKEQARMTKQLQTHKTQLQERCRNFQKKVNEYIVKYNDIQSDYNESQIKYYRAQKENDDLRLTLQQFEIQNKNLKKLVEEENNMMKEHTQKWSIRLSKLEDKSKFQGCTNKSTENKTIFTQLGQRCNKLQTEAVFEEKLSQKQSKIKELASKNQLLAKDLEQKQKIFLQLQQQQEITKTEQKHFQETYANKAAYIQELEYKCTCILEENQRINDKCTELISKYQTEVKQFQHHIKQISLSLEQQQCGNKQLIQKFEESANELEKVSQEKESLIELLELERKENAKLQKQLSKGKQESQEILIKGQQSQEDIKIYQAKISQTNAQLKEIKSFVSIYSAEIKQLNDQLEEAERNLQNQVYLKKEQGLKFEEELGYFKRKYEDIFNQNIAQAEKLRQYQRQNSTQASDKMKAELEKSQLQKSLQLKIYECEKKINLLNNQNSLLMTRISDLQIIKEGINLRLQDAENQVKNLETTNTRLTQESKEKDIRLDTLFKQMQRKQQSARETQRKTQANYEEQLKQKESVFEQRYKAALNQALEKDRQIQRFHDLLERKDKQIQSLQAIRKQIENEEWDRLKSYNVRLTQQVDETTAQFNKTFQQLQGLNLQNARYRSAISNLERDLGFLKQKNMELTAEITASHRGSQKQQEQHSYETSQLKTKIANLEERVQEQTHESSQWMHRFEEVTKECRKIQNEFNRANRSFMDQSQRKNKENNREVENYRAEIRVLQEENTQLQAVMDRQLGKRKVMIEQLLQEKKVLYEQLNRH